MNKLKFILIFAVFLLFPLSAFAVISDSIISFTHDDAGTQGTQSINNASLSNPKQFNGTLIGGVTTGVQGRIGQSYSFDDTNDRIFLNSSFSASPQIYGNITICLMHNSSNYGLSAGVWTDKGSKIFNMTKRMRAGVIWANTFNKFDPSSPFGGYKESGYGREGGLHGLLPYLNLNPLSSA